jgi:hypothetical protein
MDTTTERIVLLKLKPEHTHNAGREAVAELFRGALGGDADVGGVHVGLPADAEAERSWDLLVRLDLASLEALERLSARESYRTLFEERLPEHAVVVKAWTFRSV